MQDMPGRQDENAATQDTVYSRYKSADKRYASKQHEEVPTSYATSGAALLTVGTSNVM